MGDRLEKPDAVIMDGCVCDVTDNGSELDMGEPSSNSCRIRYIPLCVNSLGIILLWANCYNLYQ